MSEIRIIVPVYNSEKYLSNCIKSILHQTFNDFELILVNDGSVDKSLNICNKFAKRDKRIMVINKENEGSIKARRIGIEKARSKYITFVDADDWIDKFTLEVVNNDIKENNPDAIMFNMYKVIGKLPFIKRENSRLYFEKKIIYRG